MRARFLVRERGGADEREEKDGSTAVAIGREEKAAIETQRHPWFTWSTSVPV